MLRQAATSAHAASATHGEALTFETVVATEAAIAPTRVRHGEDTLLRVIAGVLRLTVGVDERRLEAGDEAIIPAGAVHQIVCEAGEARFVTGFRPARR